MTEYMGDGLRMTNDTTPEDIREFILRRIREPHRFKNGHGDEMWVFNFSTHEPDYEALSVKSNHLVKEIYVIPYQVANPWAYMNTLLPTQLREADVLAYSQEDEAYKVFPSFSRLSNRDGDTKALQQAEVELRKVGVEYEL